MSRFSSLGRPRWAEVKSLPQEDSRCFLFADCFLRQYEPSLVKDSRVDRAIQLCSPFFDFFCKVAEASRMLLAD